MPPTPSDGSHLDRTSFRCRWRLEGRAIASVRVAGELDFATAPQLRTTLDEALRYARLVLLDVSELTFVDSTGLRVMIDASHRAGSQAARVLVVGVPEELEALIDVVGVRPHMDLLRPDAGHQPPGGHAVELLAAVTDAMVALHLRHHDRVPATATTLLLDDDQLPCMTTMIELQRAPEVHPPRRAFQAATRHAFIEVVQRLSGRTVAGFISDYYVGPDIAAELFLLEPVRRSPAYGR